MLSVPVDERRDIMIDGSTGQEGTRTYMVHVLPVGRAGVTHCPLPAYVRNSGISYRWHGYPGHPDDVLVPVNHTMQGAEAVYSTKARSPQRRECTERDQLESS